VGGFKLEIQGRLVQSVFLLTGFVVGRGICSERLPFTDVEGST
jgi:hypothetical protein